MSMSSIRPSGRARQIAFQQHLEKFKPEFDLSIES
jgi:hypothetical protein